MNRESNLLQIVVIDDDKVQEIIFDGFLKLIEIPYNAKFFTNEQDMMEYLESLQKDNFPHLIFVDLYMPNRVGWEIISNLENTFQQQIKSSDIYLLTSSTYESETIEAQNCKVINDILIKPIDENKLRVIMEKASEN